MRKAREHQQPVYMCFVDFKKAIDSISHDKRWVTVHWTSLPMKESITMTEDRDNSNVKYVQGVANPRIEDG